MGKPWGKQDRRGRSKGHNKQEVDTRFVEAIGAKGVVVLPQTLIYSPAFRDLTPLAVKVLIAIQSKWTGANNGKIALSSRDMHDICGSSSNVAQADAVDELLTHGLVVINLDASFATKGLAREFRLTYAQGLDATGKPVGATNDYLLWVKADVGGRKRRVLSARRRRETKETIASGMYAETSDIASGMYAVETTIASDLNAMKQVSPQEPEIIPASDLYAHTCNTSPRVPAARHVEGMKLRAATLEMLAGAPRGTQGRLASDIGASSVQMSRLLKTGVLPPDRGIGDRLAGILRDSSRRRIYAAGRV